MNLNLFRKLTADDIEVRVQSADENGFMLLIYKNARVDQNILDETFGAFGWQNKYEEIKGNMYCSIGVKADDGEWVWKSNCGTESNTEKEKGEASDSFKRAGFNWGIGRELYTSPKIKIKGNTIEKTIKGEKKFFPEFYTYEVTDFQVSDTFPRRITALTIVGVSMVGGYHKKEIFKFFEAETENQCFTPVNQEAGKTEKTAVCEKCGASITEKVAKYSKDKLGKMLCYTCQKQPEEKQVTLEEQIISDEELPF